MRMVAPVRPTSPFKGMGLGWGMEPFDRANIKGGVGGNTTFDTQIDALWNELRNLRTALDQMRPGT